MYANRIQLVNYGPIETIDITFPFDDGQPRPVILVGENGAGKSVVLSHIVNGLTVAQGVAFPENPDVQANKVYKLRSHSYIRSQYDYYFAKVDYSGDLSVAEMRVLHRKQQGAAIPGSIKHNDAQAAWQQMRVGENDYFAGPRKNREDDLSIREALLSNCILYFPPNRFEDPAWLNEENLNAKAEYMDLRRLEGYTDRKIINYAPLHDNQNWLFDVIYDRTAFEIQTQNLNLPIRQNDQNDTSISIPLPLFLGYAGQSTSTYEIALDIVRRVINRSRNIRFGIGRRSNRAISVMDGDEQIVPNIFQLSSGETSLLNMFLSILRDFDLCGAPFNNLEDIKGIVVVDEIDLHLHAVHQHEILPGLIKTFPNVQFIVTSHSPLFVLGMEREFGSDGFALYRLPQGHQISPEEFSEFGTAYEAFAESRKFSDDVRQAIKDSQKPIVFVDGITDVKYLRKAAELQGRLPLVETLELKPADGEGQLRKIWNGARGLASNLIPQKVVLLHDCDSSVSNSTEGYLVRRAIPWQPDNPISKGVENLFGNAILEKAISNNPRFIDITPEHSATRQGQQITVPERWEVNESEKNRLCDWLCENGTADDFAGFAVVFSILDELLESQAN